MNILEFHAKITKIIETNHRIPMKTYENLINLKILCENNGNHENPRIPFENPDNHESLKIPYENHENN